MTLRGVLTTLEFLLWLFVIPVFVIMGHTIALWDPSAACSNHECSYLLSEEARKFLAYIVVFAIGFGYFFSIALILFLNENLTSNKYFHVYVPVLYVAFSFLLSYLLAQAISPTVGPELNPPVIQRAAFL